MNFNGTSLVNKLPQKEVKVSDKTNKVAATLPKAFDHSIATASVTNQKPVQIEAKKTPDGLRFQRGTTTKIETILGGNHKRGGTISKCTGSSQQTKGVR